MQFFKVDPSAVRQLGAAFRWASGTVGGEAAAFGSAARVSGEAFGRLPAGLSANSQYERKLDQAQRGLTALQATLERVAANLGSSADAYAAADQASVLG